MMLHTEETIQQHTYQFNNVEPGERLDKWLTHVLPDRSRTEIQRWIREGRVQVNRQTTKPGYRLEPNDVVTVEIPEVRPYEKIEAEPIPLSIMYEDEDIIVVDKPAGMVVHPAPGHHGGTLVNALLYHVKDLQGIGGEERPGIIHRLDKDTSGLIVVAKNDIAFRNLQRQFKERRVRKVYVALVEGHLQPRVGRIEAPIGRDKRNRKRMAVVPSGKEAVTEYHVIRYYPSHTLVEAHPITGRTHQIRVHFAFIGHPLAGDTLYGHRKQLLRPELKRHFLHARTIGFYHPRTEEWMEFRAEMPQDLQKVLARLAK